MPDVVYRAHVRIERVKGPIRRAYLPAEAQPVIFGVHGAVAEHYKVPPAVLEPHETAEVLRISPQKRDAGQEAFKILAAAEIKRRQSSAERD